MDRCCAQPQRNFTYISHGKWEISFPPFFIFFLFLRGSVCVVDSIFSLSDERVLPVRRVLTDMRSERRNEHTQKDERIKTC